MIDLSEVLEVASASHSGMVRSHNEDSIATDSQAGLAILADGMGGYNAGEVASGIATQMLAEQIRNALASVEVQRIHKATGETLGRITLRETISMANTSIYQAAKTQPQYSGMGTTLVMTLFYDNSVDVAHIGDSRLYRLRGEVFEQVTRDHSLLQEQIDSGMISKADARLSLNKNLVTRALGIDPEVEPEIRTYAVSKGDIYLLCSDGLTDMVEDEAIASALLSYKDNLPVAAGKLVQMANDNGGRDNISVILVSVKEDFSARVNRLNKLFSWFR